MSHIIRKQHLILKTVINNIMKRIITIIVICLILIPTVHIFAQNRVKRIEGEKFEKKADRNSFIIYHQGDLNVVYNKNNVLMIYESDFETKTNEINLDIILRLPERTKVDNLIIKTIAPFYRNFKSISLHESEEFEIYFHAKPDGKVCELVFRYDREAKIPLKIIEKLEKEILSLNLEFDFIGHEYFYTDVSYVYYPVRYSVGRMKKNLTEENK